MSLSTDFGCTSSRPLICLIERTRSQRAHMVYVHDSFAPIHSHASCEVPPKILSWKCFFIPHKTRDCLPPLANFVPPTMATSYIWPLSMRSSNGPSLIRRRIELRAGLIRRRKLAHTILKIGKVLEMHAGRALSSFGDQHSALSLHDLADWKFLDFSSSPTIAARLRKLNIDSMPAPPPGGVPDR